MKSYWVANVSVKGCSLWFVLLVGQIITIVKGAILYGAVSDVSALHATKGGVYKTNHE
jgi:hypothetical protein